MMTTNQIAKLLRTDHRVIKKIARKLGIKPIKIGNAYVFSVQEVELIKEEHRKIARSRRG